MLYKTILTLFVSTLVAVGEAHVVARSGFSIPLGPPVALRRSDGTFDHRRAIAHVQYTRNKYRANLIDPENNVGRAVPNEGIRIKRQNVPLDGSDTSQCLGPITLGSDSQISLVTFDTAAGDLWVSNAHNCPNCSGHNTYDPTMSSSSHAVGGTFQVQYVDGSTVAGPVFTDQVSVGGVKVSNQTFAAVTQRSGLSSSHAIDGVLGMSYPSLSTLNASPFIQTAFAQNVISSEGFSFALRSQGGSVVIIGAPNPSIYSGTLDNHPVNTSSGFWQLGGTSLLLETQVVFSGLNIILDTSTAFIFGPPDQVKTFYGLIPGTQLADSTNGIYTFPCSFVPDVAFLWGNTGWKVTNNNFNLGPVSTGSGQCIGAIVGPPGRDFGGAWVAGLPFLMDQYTAFSFDQNAVGFAELA